MEDSLKQIAGILQAMWLKRWAGLVASLVVAIGGLVGVGLYRDRYEASASIYVDTASVLKPLMNGLAFQPDVEQQISMLARTLISRPNIERLLEMPGVGKPSDPRAYERLIKRLTENIKVTARGGTKANLFEISFRDKDGEYAGRIVASLVDMFVSTGMGDRRRDSQDARRFIDDQIRTYEAKLAEAEGRLKDFKVRHFGMSGTSGNNDYFSRMSQLSDEVSRLRLELRAAEQSAEAYRRQLATEDPQLPPEAMATQGVPPPSESDTRLDNLRRTLDELQRRYTDDHPDVAAARSAIVRLEAQKRAEAEAAKAGRSGRQPAATSPVFQQIKIALAQAEAQAASLRAQLAEQQSRLDQARAVAGRVPEVEAELAQLNRDYEVIRKNYEELVTRRESAALGVKIDESARSTDFRVVEPARVAQQPVFPSRIVLAGLMVLASVAAGLALAFLLSQLLPTFANTRALAQVTGRPVLGSVSVIVGEADRFAQARDRARFFGACAGVLIVQVGWVMWIWLRGRL